VLPSPCEAWRERGIVARDETKAKRAVERIEGAGGPGTTVDVLMADLGSQAGVRRLASEVLERYPRLDVLVNNAGAMYSKRQMSPDGIELTWALNHLAPFLLTAVTTTTIREAICREQNKPTRFHADPSSHRPPAKLS
jgi:NAD(P)-dependent dehydrogenase (short-subunit alcohol dehydrogenase family)